MHAFTKLGEVPLLLYGAVNVLVAWAVLAGWITTSAGTIAPPNWATPRCWDQLFFAWGLCLAAGLVLTRRPTATPYSPTRKYR